MCIDMNDSSRVIDPAGFKPHPAGDSFTDLLNKLGKKLSKKLGKKLGREAPPNDPQVSAAFSTWISACAYATEQLVDIAKEHAGEYVRDLCDDNASRRDLADRQMKLRERAMTAQEKIAAELADKAGNAWARILHHDDVRRATDETREPLDSAYVAVPSGGVVSRSNTDPSGYTPL